MSASVFDSPLMIGLFSAPKIAAEWEVSQQLHYIVTFERAYTNAMAKVGQISETQKQEALSVFNTWTPDLDALALAARRDGLIIPELVKSLRASSAHPTALHTGSTSQDVLDTALVLTLKAVTDILKDGLQNIILALQKLDQEFGANTLMGRTRMQAALPIQATTRLAAWSRPLANHLDVLNDLRGRLLQLQLGGPVGDRKSMKGKGDQIGAHMATELDLGDPGFAWHSDRSALVEFGDWLSRVTGSLGKMGQDICLMAQQGIDEISLSGGGGSSAMPHKSNPILAEFLVTLSRYNTAQSSGLQQGMVHEQERSGTSWALEWMILPTMTMTTGTAINAAQDVLEQVVFIGSETQQNEK